MKLHKHRKTGEFLECKAKGKCPNGGLHIDLPDNVSIHTATDLIHVKEHDLSVVLHGEKIAVTLTLDKTTKAALYSVGISEQSIKRLEEKMDNQEFDFILLTKDVEEGFSSQFVEIMNRCLSVLQIDLITFVKKLEQIT